MKTMKAVVFRGNGQIAVEEVPKPVPGPGEAVIKITATTICGTDVHIVRGEYPVKPGLVLGHEPVGVIDELGAGLDRYYRVGERVIAGAITPCGQCFYCLNGSHSQCGGPLGGWRFGNTINGAWAEYFLVPDARANLAPIPPDLADESVLMCPDIFSTGLSGAESGNIRVGDAVAIFAQGPIGLCATVGAKLRGAGLIIAVDAVESRLDTARRFGANVDAESGTGRRSRDDQAPHRWPRRRRRDRSPGQTGDVRERSAIDSCRRHVLEPRRLFGQGRRSLRGVLCRAG